jgi:putative tryptophan/tyrosine transport system substrate-binding protein
VKRREFITLLGGAAGAWPLGARAQQPALPVVGFLSSRSPAESTAVTAAFRQGLHETGFVEGQNLAIAFRWAEGRYELLPALAADLVGLRVAVLLAAGGPPAASAAKAATSTIPIVFSAASDPIRLGLVASLNRPGANITGMGTFNAALVAKRLEILNELVPSAAAMGYLVNPTNQSADIELQEVSAAAKALGIELSILNASTEQELDDAFAGAAKLRLRGVVVAGEPFFDSRRERIVTLAARYAVPASYGFREYVTGGGLISYGTSITDSYRQAGIYVGRILKGEKPADMPVMQPTKFELAINLKTARTLGLTVPDKLLVAADEVIE